MRIVERRVYVGPNLYARFPVVRLTVALGPLEELPSHHLEGFGDRLLGWLPGLRDHGCSYGVPGGFARRLAEGTWMGHVLEHVAIALQNLAGGDLSFGKTRGTGVLGEYHVVYGWQDSGEVGLAAGDAALRLVELAWPPEVAGEVGAAPGGDPASVIAAFLRFASQRRLGPSAGAIVREAARRGIPWERLDDASFVLLGTGCHARRVQGTVTDRTSAIAAGIAADPERTRRLLAGAGLPVAAEIAGEGAAHRLLVVDGALVAATARDGGEVEAHAAVAELAVRAAAVVGLDVAGVDYVTTDPCRSWRDAAGAIRAVAAGPELELHGATDVAGPIVDALFPPGAPAAVPVIAVTGTNGKTTTARMVAHLHAVTGAVVGLATTDGVEVGGRIVEEGDLSGPRGARLALHDPRVEVAVLEVARGGLLRAGMGVPRCDVGAVTNVSADHLGAGGIETLEELARLKRLVVEVATGTAVLSADGPLTRAMARHHGAERLCWVSVDPLDPILRDHISDGRPAVVLDRTADGERLVLHHDGAASHVLWVREIPVACDGVARHNVENAMFAAAIAWASGVPIDAIREGLASFAASAGRFEVWEGPPCRVIVDYGHNAAAFTAVADAVERMAPPGRRICVIGAPGDRRDADLRAAARGVATRFDRFFVKEDADLRGRPPGAVARLLVEGLVAGGATDVHVVLDGDAALTAALETAGPGDLLTVFAEHPDRALARLRRGADPSRGG